MNYVNSNITKKRKTFIPDTFITPICIAGSECRTKLNQSRNKALDTHSVQNPQIRHLKLLSRVNIAKFRSLKS